MRVARQIVIWSKQTAGVRLELKYPECLTRQDEHGSIVDGGAIAVVSIYIVAGSREKRHSGLVQAVKNGDAGYEKRSSCSCELPWPKAQSCCGSGTGSALKIRAFIKLMTPMVDPRPMASGRGIR